MARTGRARELLGDVARYGATTALGRVLNLGLIVALTKFGLFTPAELGLWDYLLAATVPLAILSNLGGPGGVLLLWNDSKAADYRQRLLVSSLLVQISMGLASFAIIWIFRFQLAALLGVADSGAAFLIASAIALVGSLLLLVQAALRADRRIWTSGLVSSAAGLLPPILGLAAVYLFDAGPAGLLSARLLSLGVALVVGIAVVRRYVGSSLDLRLVWSTLLIGTPYLLTFVSRWAVNQSDRFFIKAWWTLADMGTYAIAIKLTAIVGMTLAVFQRAWAPWALSVHREDGAARSFARILETAAGITSLLALAVSLYGKELLQLLTTSEYVAASSVLIPLAFARAYEGISIGAQIGLGIKKRTGTVGLVYVGGATLNIALNALLVRHFGILAAGITTLVAYAVTTLVIAELSRRMAGVPLRSIRLLAAPALCFLVAAGSAAAEAHVNVHLILGLAAKLGLLVATTAMMWVLRLLPGPKAVWATLKG